MYVLINNNTLQNLFLLWLENTHNIRNKIYLKEMIVQQR